MRREVGRAGCTTTWAAVCQTGLRRAGTAPEPSLRLDSGNHFQAQAALVRQRAAAMNPGAVWPKWDASEPSNGPMAKAAPVADESQPSALARWEGSMVSAT